MCAKRSNTADINPKNINFDAVRKNLENKITEIKSYKPKQLVGQAKQWQGGIPSAESEINSTPTSMSNLERKRENNPLPIPEQSAYNEKETIRKEQPSSGHLANNYFYNQPYKENQPRKVDNYEPSYAERLQPIYDQERFNSLSRDIGSLGNRIDSNSLRDKIDRIPSGYDQERLSSISRDIGSLGNRVDSNSLRDKIDRIPSGYDQERLSSISKDIGSLGNRVDNNNIDTKINFLRDKLDNDKLTNLEKNIGDVYNKLNNKQVADSINTIGDIKRKLDILEQSRVDEIRLLNESRRIDDLLRHIDRLESKMDTATPLQNNQAKDIEAIKNILHSYSKDSSDNKDNTDIMNDLKRKLDIIEQNRTEDIRSVSQNDKIDDLARHLDKLESKMNIAVPTQNRLINDSEVLDGIKNTLNTYSKDSAHCRDSVNTLSDLKRKLENLEQVRANDIRLVSESKKIDDLARHLDKLESKIDTTVPMQNKQIRDVEALVEIRNKLDNLERDRIADLKSKIEHDQFYGAEKAMLVAEDRGNKHGKTTEDSLLFNTIESIQKRLDKLELHGASSLKDSSYNDKVQALSDDIKAIKLGLSRESTTSHTNEHMSALEKIQKKLEKIEDSRLENLRDSIEKERFVNVNKYLERLEAKIRPTGNASVEVETSNIEKKLERLEKVIFDSLNVGLNNDKIIATKSSDMELIEARLIDLSKKVDGLSNARVEGLHLKIDEERNINLLKTLDRLENNLSSGASPKEFFHPPKADGLSTITKQTDGLENKIDNSTLSRILNKFQDDLKTKFDEVIEKTKVNSANTNEVAILSKQLAELKDSIHNLKTINSDEVIEKTKVNSANTNEVAILSKQLAELKDSIHNLKTINSDEVINKLGMIEKLQQDFLKLSASLEKKEQEYTNNMDINKVKKSDTENTITDILKYKLASDLINEDKNNFKVADQNFSFRRGEVEQLKSIEKEEKILKNTENLVSMQNESAKIIEKIGSEIKNHTLRDKYIDRQTLIKEEIDSLRRSLEKEEQLILKLSARSGLEDRYVKDMANSLASSTKIISDSAEDTKILSKVDALSNVVAKIENMIRSNDAGLNYKKEIEESLSKLKSDNENLLRMMQNNQDTFKHQTLMLSEKSESFMNSLKEDILSSSKLENKSLVEELSFLHEKIESLRSLVNNSENNDEIKYGLRNLFDNLTNMSTLQHETISYFKKLDVIVTNSLLEIQKTAKNYGQKLLSEIGVYLNDSKDKATYFRDLKEKLDENSDQIAKFIGSNKDRHDDLVGLTVQLKSDVDDVAQTIENLFDINDKSRINLEVLVLKAEKMLESQGKVDDSVQEIKNNVSDTKDNLALNLQKTSDMVEKASQSALKDDQLLRAIENNDKTLTTVESKLTSVMSTTEDVTGNINKLRNANEIVGNSLNEKIKTSNDNLLKLHEELSSMSYKINNLEGKSVDIAQGVDEAVKTLREVEESVADVLSKIGEINTTNTLDNIIQVLADLSSDNSMIKNMVGKLNNDMNFLLGSANNIDKSIKDNFTSFMSDKDKQLSSIMADINMFNHNISSMSSGIITKDNVESLVIRLDNLMKLQEVFFDDYSKNFMDFVNKIERLDSNIKEFGNLNSLKIKKEASETFAGIRNKSQKRFTKALDVVVSSGANRDFKKPDLHGNMEYLSKEIAKKISED